ncbi:hypothetical protein, partial [Mesorhizobium sp.]|uniref:hypothetical protein n=1 Tax=Mesorhizobium sp. TaxID=1871066 RepID=UPI00257B2334
RIDPLLAGLMMNRHGILLPHKINHLLDLVKYLFEAGHPHCPVRVVPSDCYPLADDARCWCLLRRGPSN